jgi:hypothetical protein
MDESGDAQQNKFFSGASPESGSGIRQSSTDLPAQRSGPPAQPAMSAAELRLYVWSELPERHRNEVCRQIRIRCDSFISSLRVDRRERKTEIDRLLSEVVAHLLRATSVRIDETPMDPDLPEMGASARSASGPAMLEADRPKPWLAKGPVDERDPTRDARVNWLIEDTCNRQALFHRYEDMRRRDRGGKWDGSGYPLVAVDQQTIEQLSGHYDPTEEETSALQAEDSRRAWEGLVELAVRQFGPDDDVVALVQVLAEDRNTQESFGSQWPIGKIVRALNQRAPGETWNDDRVDNAKRRLTKLIVRIKQANGLDAVDLRALLARYARERRAAAGRPPPTT